MIIVDRVLAIFRPHRAGVGLSTPRYFFDAPFFLSVEGFGGPFPSSNVRANFVDLRLHGTLLDMTMCANPREMV